jgi:glycosyltransferase involved in cell wall biosynthesis
LSESFPPLASVAVVIPALNEEDCISQTILATPEVGSILVVDNGSQDRTAERARDAGASVIKEVRPGYGRAVLAGLLEARLRGHSVGVVLDADASNDPASIPTLVGPILSGRADFVLAQRTQFAEKGSLTRPQRFGNRLATRMIRTLTGHSYSDMGPFRALHLRHLPLLNLGDPNYGWNIEMQIKAVQNNLRIVELQLPYRVRRAGKSKISGDLRASVEAGAKIILAGLRYA